MNANPSRAVPVLKQLNIATVDLPGGAGKGFLLTATAHPTPDAAETSLRFVVPAADMEQLAQLFQRAATSLRSNPEPVPAAQPEAPTAALNGAAPPADHLPRTGPTPAPEPLHGVVVGGHARQLAQRLQGYRMQQASSHRKDGQVELGQWLELQTQVGDNGPAATTELFAPQALLLQLMQQLVRQPQ